MAQENKGVQIIVPSDNSSDAGSMPGGGKKGLWITASVLLILICGGFFWYWNQSVPIYLELTPANATIVVDGNNRTLSPDGFIEVKRGNHILEVVSPGFKSHNRNLIVRFESSQSYDIVLEEQPGLLSVTTDPADATVTIDGEVLGVTPLLGLEIPAGEHQVLIEKENYLPHTTEIAIAGKLARSQIETNLTPAWSRVSLNTTPEGATLYVNGDRIGNTPIEMDLLLGTYALRLEMPEREPQQFNIRVPANQTIELPTRALDWKHGSLFVGTSPPGAWVAANGNVLGQTPGTFSVPSKEKLAITVTLLDHEESKFELNLKPEEAVERRIELKPLTGTLRIETAPQKAEIYLDGRIQGLSPVTLKLPVKDHSFEIRKAGFIPQSHTLRPLANKTARHSFTLAGENRGTPLTDDQIVRALIAQKDDIPLEVSTPYGYKLKLIEPDTYTMGLPVGYPGRGFDETSIQMRIRQPFYMGVYEVTNRDFKRFRTEHDSGIVQGVSLQSGDRPATGISWRDAVEYCNWLSDVQGFEPAYQEIDGQFVMIEPRTDGYRLPTEVEWEYAARYNSGTATLPFYWGKYMPPLEKSGNFAGNEAKVMIGQSINGYRDGYRATSPVGAFNPNSLGLFDMGGNVAEWCTDFYSYTFPSSPRPLLDWAGPEKGEQRVIRGASWRSVTEKDLRATHRRHGTDGADDVGFRLVRSYPIIIE